MEYSTYSPFIPAGAGSSAPDLDPSPHFGAGQGVNAQSVCNFESAKNKLYLLCGKYSTEENKKSIIDDII